MAYATLVERTIPVSRSKVFAEFADFAGLNKYLPDVIQSIRLEGEGIGALRIINLKPETGFPGVVVERVETLFDERVFSYSIVGKPAIPVDNYVAVVELRDAPNGGCVVRYGSNWTPDGATEREINDFLENVYNTICNGIAAQHA